MSAGVLVQARLSSRRLPGKVLMPVAGRPLLGHLLDSLRQCRYADKIIVTTSIDWSDDAVASFCAAEDVACYRGDLDNVAARMLAAAQAHGVDVIARVSGDSPLLDHRLVDTAISLFSRGESDLVTNVHPRTFPKGQSVEVFTTASLSDAVARMNSPKQREHVTTLFYEEDQRWRISNFERPRRTGNISMAVDTTTDAGRVEALVRSLDAPPWTYNLDELETRWKRLQNA